MANQDQILLCAVNSTYQHAAFGLRYLKANLNELSDLCRIQEFTIAQDPKDIAEKILLKKPQILGFGVYIWNTLEVLEILKIIKKVAPEIIIVLGGPEISYETKKQEHLYFSDFIIPGEADFSFYNLCKKILTENYRHSNSEAEIIPSELPEINKIKLPYDLYNDEDIKNRVIYVEASRGCPYKCEYCLSSLDKSVRNFDLQEFLIAMENLMQRGVREYKFVDRTFNLSPSISKSILEFFQKHLDKGLFLHFEMVPDRLPDELKELIRQFPAGSLQFEIGIQTLNEEVSKNVSRRQNVEKIKENFDFLKKQTHVHTHADLIVGLPGETWDTFKNGFDNLTLMGPDEIQVGILKRLRGTPITRHDQTFEMKYADKPPYQIFQNKNLDFLQIQSLVRFSKHWDMIANSGNWKSFMQLLKTDSLTSGKSFFDRIYSLSLFLSDKHPQSHGISLINLSESLFSYMIDVLNWQPELAVSVLLKDYCFNKKRDLPVFLKNSHTYKELTLNIYEKFKAEEKASTSAANIKSVKKRQMQHVE